MYFAIFWERGAIAIKHFVGKIFYPRLEQLFKKYDVTNQHWNVDLLEVKIPEVQKRYWKEELVEKTLAQIEDYLIRYNPKMAMQISESLVKNPVLIVPLEKRASLLVFDFLQTGTLRSNSISNKITTVLEKVIVDETFAITLQQLFKKDIKMLLRWVFFYP